MTTVISIKKNNLVKLGYKNLEEWIKDENNVYIGRNCPYVSGATESIWKNPFSANKYGRDECIIMFKKYLEKNETLLSNINKLKGKTLGCWCKPEACHGDVLAEICNKSR